MFEYMICNVPDKSIFDKQCNALRKKLPSATVKSRLEDVDGSQYITLDYQGYEIKVSNDYYIGGVFVQSEIELTQFFK